jgi:hypothetical protein
MLTENCSGWYDESRPESPVMMKWETWVFVDQMHN